MWAVINEMDRIILLKETKFICLSSDLTNSHMKSFFAFSFSRILMLILCFFLRPAVQPSQVELQRQRSMEVAQLYRQRRHISQEDTISLNPAEVEGVEEGPAAVSEFHLKHIKLFATTIATH